MAAIGIAVVLLFVLSRAQRVLQDWLMQVFGQMSPWILWTLVLVLPAIPVVYTLTVWLRSRYSTPSSDSKEDA
jgi:hypothetical protein